MSFSSSTSSSVPFLLLVLSKFDARYLVLISLHKDNFKQDDVMLNILRCRADILLIRDNLFMQRRFHIFICFVNYC